MHRWMIDARFSFHSIRIRNPFRIYFRDNALRKRRRERSERSHASRSYSSVRLIITRVILFLSIYGIKATKSSSREGAHVN